LTPNPLSWALPRLCCRLLCRLLSCVPTAPVAVRSLPQQRRSRIQQHVAVPLGGPSCPRTTKCAGRPDGHYAALLPVNVALQRAGAVRASLQVLPQRQAGLRRVRVPKLAHSRRRSTKANASARTKPSVRALNPKPYQRVGLGFSERVRCRRRPTRRLGAAMMAVYF
jgi:hypothetical protein